MNLNPRVIKQQFNNMGLSTIMGITFLAGNLLVHQQRLSLPASHYLVDIFFYNKLGMRTYHDNLSLGFMADIPK